MQKNIYIYFDFALFFTCIQMVQFERELRALWDAIGDFVLLSPLASSQLSLLGKATSVPVRWQDFLSLNLSHGIFANSFVGVDRLQQKLADMVWVAMCMGIHVVRASLKFVAHV